MRQIKFRIRNVNNGQWAYFNLTEGFSFLDNYNKETIGQFTSLLDKNGKEIYEGDILKDDQNCLLEVKFGKLPLGKSGDCVCTYEAWYGRCYGKLGQAPYYECQEIADWMEIIGNVWENPNLLQ